MTRIEALRILSEIQHGLVARRQTRRLRFGHRQIGRMVASGEWVEATDRVLRRTGAPTGRFQELMLGVLDGPSGSFLSFASAGEVWRIPSFDGLPVEVSHARSVFQRPSAGRIHRPTLILPHHVTTVDGVPTTTLARTLFDLAHWIHEDRLDVILDRIIAKSPGILPALRQMLEELQGRGRPGIAAMRAQLARRPTDYVPVATGLERRFERLFVQATEGRVRRQVDLGGHDWIGRVDFFDELKVIYEVDSILHHTTPGDRARDNARDRALIAAGYAKVVRVPEEDIWYHPERAIRAIREARAEVRAAFGNSA